MVQEDLAISPHGLYKSYVLSQFWLYIFVNCEKYNSGQKETKIGNGERKRNGRKRERAFSLPLGHHSHQRKWERKNYDERKVKVNICIM